MTSNFNKLTLLTSFKKPPGTSLGSSGLLWKNLHQEIKHTFNKQINTFNQGVQCKTKDLSLDVNNLQLKDNGKHFDLFSTYVLYIYC